jgi:hypothetical protein
MGFHGFYGKVIGTYWDFNGDKNIRIYPLVFKHEQENPASMELDCWKNPRTNGFIFQHALFDYQTQMRTMVLVYIFTYKTG